MCERARWYFMLCQPQGESGPSATVCGVILACGICRQTYPIMGGIFSQLLFSDALREPENCRGGSISTGEAKCSFSQLTVKHLPVNHWAQ